MEKQNRPTTIEGVDFSRFNITDDEAKWLNKARPGEVQAFLRGEIDGQYLQKSIQQDMECRHITGHAGLHEYISFHNNE